MPTVLTSSVCFKRLGLIGTALCTDGCWDCGIAITESKQFFSWRCFEVWILCLCHTFSLTMFPPRVSLSVPCALLHSPAALLWDRWVQRGLNIPLHPNFYGLIFRLLLCFCSASRVSTLINCNKRCTCTRSRLYGNKTHADLHLNNTVCNIVCLAHILSSSPESCPPTKLTGSACIYIWDLNLWGPWSMNYPDLKWSLTHAMGNTDPCQHVSMLFPSVATVFWQQMSLR